MTDLKEDIEEYRIWKGQIVFCPECKSNDVRKAGKRYNRYSINQKFMCNECERKFSLTDEFRRMRHPKEMILYALKLRKEGKTYREIAREVSDEFKIKISAQSILGWDKKFEDHNTLNHKEKVELVLDNIKDFLSKHGYVAVEKEKLNRLLMICDNYYLKRNPVYRMGIVREEEDKYEFVKSKLKEVKND